MKHLDFPLPHDAMTAPVPDASVSSTATPGWLNLRDISKSFGATQVLRDVGLQVDKGEFICLLGPSGCGKTTLLRILAGLERQDQGEIFMQERDIGRLPPAARDYGIVFQSYALFPNMTVSENVAYALRMPARQRAQRVGELLDMVSLNGKEKYFPAQLSGGQQQRVALARALATSPSLLLLDEPLSALDAKVREHLRQELRNLQQKLGVTTIMVTHDQEEALGMADRIAVMANGGIEQIGTPEQIYRAPATRLVADFVGRANWLPVQIDDQGLADLGGLLFQTSLPAGPALAFCRPEDIGVETHWEANRSAAMAVIEKVDFHGGQRRGVLALCGNRSIRVQADISPNHRGYDKFVVGMRVPIVLPRHNMRFFAEDAA